MKKILSLLCWLLITPALAAGHGTIGIAIPQCTGTYNSDYGLFEGNYPGPGQSMGLYVSPWGVWPLIQGSDYSECSVYNNSTFPANTSFYWYFPERPPLSGGIYGYNNLFFNNYDWSPVEWPLAPQQLSALTTLTAAFSISYTGEGPYFDIIFDTFTTSQAVTVGNDPSPYMTHEIEFFLHTPPYSLSYVQSVTQHGTINVSGITWNVATDTGLSPPDILVWPNTVTNSNPGDVLSTTLDLKAMFAALATAGVISNTEYFNGTSIGVEARQGNGSMTISSLTITFN